MSAPCPVCRNPGVFVTGPFEGYVERWFTSLATCESCELSFSVRRDIPDGMYESIYAQAAEIPGYDRYFKYSVDIKRQVDPLSWLAAQEDAYLVPLTWLESRKEVGSVLELGSGLGYLTFALRRAGYDAVGVDISEEAVRSARARYSAPDGFFTPGEILGKTSGGFDVVIALEVIEHVADPVQFVREAMEYLRPGGTLIMSTPNRDAFTSTTLWDSDLPPVHLTWLGSRAMAAVASSVEAEMEIIQVREPSSVRLPVSGANVVFDPMLTADGRSSRCARRWSSRRWARVDGLLSRVPTSVRKGRRHLEGLPRTVVVPPSSSTLGVALRRGV